MALTRKSWAGSAPETRPGRRWFPSIDGDWRDDAACLGVDSEIFFSQAVESIATAKEVCCGCPVRAECLDFALTNRERYGIWGGRTEQSRALLAARIAARADRPAGGPGDDDGPVAA